MTEGKFLPMLFLCYECDRTHALVDGNYVFENVEGARAKDTKFWCIPCARKVHGNELVDSIFKD